MSKEILQNIIEEFKPAKFVRFFREKNRAFAPRQEGLFQYDDENFKNGLRLGEIRFTDDYLLICAFAVNQTLTEKSGKKAQYEKGKAILKGHQEYTAGIFIFYDHNGNFRFSLIYDIPIGNKRDWSAFRRFTYFVSSDFTNKTFLQRVGEGDFSSLEKIKDAFSVEKVTKEFYTSIANWYDWAVAQSTFPKDAEKDKNGKDSISIIRLITRLIFIWFMRERGLVPKGLFQKNEISKWLNGLSPEKTTYYKAILQNLFFATLNTKQEERKFRFEKSFQGKNTDYMDHRVYRYDNYFKNQEDMLEIFKDIPFLNGGLFDCLDRPSKENDEQGEVRMDGFSDEEKGLQVPNFLFFSDETNTRGLIDILSSYNFTVDENDPNDQEVALDPELLGKVFENLLATFNPETSTTARKATGSYYTPREIVDYMVTQSLKEHFKTHLKDVDGIDDKLTLLFSYDNKENPFSSDASRLVYLIDDLRIVDPAVGSGAFPMGILNKLVFILSKLDPENIIWKEAQIKAVEESVPDPIIKQKLKEHIEGQFIEKGSNYGRKLYLIQKCIYGVDIQQIAVEIAKLRFFISLLVDENIDKKKKNWGIEPLPNLDFKIMQGNSLISEFMGINFDANGGNESKGMLFADETEKLIRNFQQKKSEFQNESDHKKREVLRKEIDNLIIQIFETKLKKQKSEYFRQLQGIESKYSRLPNEKQRIEVIAKEKTALYEKTGFNLESVEKRLQEYTNSLKIKPFFLWKLYFAEVFQGENPGFDIVIANPPYVEHKKLKYISPVLKKNYLTYSGTADLYVYFYENGIRNLKENGILVYITSNKFLKTSYGENLRKYFTTFKISEIINFTDVHVFEALVASCIFSISRSNNSNNNVKVAFANDSLLNFADLIGFVDNNKFFLKQSTLSEKIWQLENETKLSLKEKIENGSVAMSKTGTINICRGVTTGFNPAFIINEKKRKELIKEDKANISVIKPLLQGRNIRKWIYQESNNYLLQTGYDTNIKKDYPIIYDHLKLFKNELEIRADQGVNWWNLRACRYYSEFEKEKIIWGLTADKWAFAYDNKNHYLPSNGYILISKNIPLKYLLALMNSNLMEFYFGFMGIMTAGGAYTLKHETISLLPIKETSDKVQKPFIEIVDKILVITKSSDYLENPAKKAEVKEYEHQIDQMVYNLYGLTEEEIKIIAGEN